MLLVDFWLLEHVSYSDILCCNTQTMAGRLKESVSAQSKSVGPKEQQKNVATGGDVLIKDEHNQKRQIVAENAFNDDERKETSTTLPLENDSTKAAVIVLVSDDDLSDEWEDYPKPDPVTSRREKGHLKCGENRKGGSGAKSKKRETPLSTKPRLLRGKRQTHTKRSSLGNDSAYLRPSSAR